MRRRRLFSGLGRSLSTYAFVIPFSAIILFPFAVMLISAIKSNAEIFVGIDEFRWLPEAPQWENFWKLQEKVPQIWRFFLNSAIIASGSTMLSVAFALPAAYALARLTFRGRGLFLQAVLVTQMFSPIVIIIGLYKLFVGTSVDWFFAIPAQIGLDGLFSGNYPSTLINNLFGLILANAAFNLAFAIWLLSGYFSSVPREIEEAGMVDGCSWIRLITQILLPLAAPGIVTATIFVFIASWNEFIFALTLLSSPEKRPIIIGLFSLMGMYEVEWNFVMAGALLAVIPVVVLFWLAEKHLASGLTAGAVK